MLLSPHMFPFCKFNFFITTDYFHGVKQPCIYDLLLFATSLCFNRYDLLWTPSFNLALSMEVLSIDFHTSITNTLVYKKSNSTTPYASFVETTFLNYFKSYYLMTWHRCAVNSSSNFFH